MIVVSGCPRSGTSLMMDCLRCALGENRIVGRKWPMKRHEEALERQKGEAPERHQFRRYVAERTGTLQTIDEVMQHARDMNPNGFWEDIRVVCDGLQWTLELRNILHSSRAVKIIANALPATNPDFVDGLIYVVRHPKEVAVSQDDLRRAPFPPNAFQSPEMKVQNPRRFITGTARGARWLDVVDVPRIVVDHKALMEQPDSALNRIREIVPEADFSEHPIDPSLYRSHENEIIEPDNPLWNDAVEQYEALLEDDFQAAAESFAPEQPRWQRQEATVPCPRRERMAAYRECLHCRRFEHIRDRFREQAEADCIEWRGEPCGFECGFALLEDLCYDSYLSVEESVGQNHWKD